MISLSIDFTVRIAQPLNTFSVSKHPISVRIGFWASFTQISNTISIVHCPWFSYRARRIASQTKSGKIENPSSPKFYTQFRMVNSLQQTPVLLRPLASSHPQSKNGTTSKCNQCALCAHFEPFARETLDWLFVHREKTRTKRNLKTVLYIGLSLFDQPGSQHDPELVRR